MGFEKNEFIKEILSSDKNLTVKSEMMNVSFPFIKRYCDALFPQKKCYSENRFLMERLNNQEKLEREKNAPTLPKDFQRILLSELKEELKERSAENLLKLSSSPLKIPTQKQSQPIQSQLQQSQAQVHPQQQSPPQIQNQPQSTPIDQTPAIVNLTSEPQSPNNFALKKRGRPKKSSFNDLSTFSPKKRLIGEEDNLFVEDQNKMDLPPEEAKKWWMQLIHLKKQNLSLHKQLEETKTESTRKEKILESEIHQLQNSLNVLKEEFAIILAKLKKEIKVDLPNFDLLKINNYD